MNIQQSSELVLFVTHVEADEAYLKIWGQLDKSSATCVERMILPLAEQFARSQGCADPHSSGLRVNALCCARFQDDGYYRAKVLSVRADGMVVLQFIDYGNIEVLPPQEIHLLETIPGSESLQSFPPVAFDFTLMHILPITGIWENKIIETIKKSLWYNEYKILIHSVINNHRLIKLCYNDEDFAELLVKKHMAIPATLQEMFRSKSMQQPQPAMYQPMKPVIGANSISMGPMQVPGHYKGNDVHVYPQSIPANCPFPQKQIVVQPPPVQEALVFKSRVLDVGSKHEVYVSFVEDGPHKFSVQVQSTTQVLSMLMKEINMHPIEPLQEPPLPGSVCLGRYTPDKVLCRAVVMSVMENKCKLYYVDFGHTEVLPYTDIFQLPPHYISPKVLSIRFTLSGVKELNVTPQMKEYFKQIVSGKPLILHVRPPEGPPLVQYGDLYDNGKNIKDILRQAFPTPPVKSPAVVPVPYQEARKLMKGTEEMVHVSYVESCRKFFVQLDATAAALDSIMTCLAEFCKSAPSLKPTQLIVGLPCAALYENQWYRAKIINVESENVRVLYVDYGNEEMVTLTSLRLIHDDLVRKLQAQAIKCALNGAELLARSDEISKQFESMIYEKRLCMRVADTYSDGVLVDLYDSESMEDIKSHLLNANDRNANAGFKRQTIDDQKMSRINLKTSPSENTNKWNKKGQSDPWQESNDNTSHERNRSKTWKDELNEEKQYENKYEKSNFYRGDSRNDRFNKDDFSSKRNSKEKWNNKYETNETNSFNRSGTSPRGGRNRSSGNASKHNYSSNSDKSWSDKDSDTSSRHSGKRGRSNVSRGNYAKRDGPGKMQSNRWNDKDSSGRNYKSDKPNAGDFYNGRNKFADKKGQGHRIAHNKFNAANYNPAEEVERHGVIPRANAIVGTKHTCELVFTNSPSDFFIQLSADYAKLDSVMENIAAIYESGGEPMQNSEIASGAYCIAQYSVDSKWYRAVIKSVEGNSATVQFVDYGNTETIEFSCLKIIDKEFLKLSMQAIHCKLLGVEDSGSDGSRMQEFEDATSGKTLEAEFVAEANDIYSVLLREVVEGCPTETCVNEQFCAGADLLKLKEEAMKQNQAVKTTNKFVQPDYALPDAKWSTTTYTSGMKQDVIITWFTNPNNFYCQTLDRENEFRAMMNEIQKMYVGREPASNALKIGSPVLAIFSEDRALYRAEIVDLNKPTGHVVQYIDFGNCAVVQQKKIYPVEKKLMHLPKQAVHCSLTNVVPKEDGSWSKVNKEPIDKCFNADKFVCTFHDAKDNNYSVSLSNSGKDVADTLVERGLALFADSQPTEKTVTKSIIEYDLQKVDISLLSGQALRVKVSSVENINKFHIQLPSGIESEKMINTYMADKDPKGMQRLSAHEMCLGTGCLVQSNGTWRRAVTCNRSESTGVKVKLIDTGVYDEILSDRVLALPGELAVIQNQAIECSLRNDLATPETNDKLREQVEGKEVVIYVDEVNDNRLIVKLYDLLGNKINVTEDSTERIPPVCPMPILSSTHKVSVSYADHSASIWLQRDSDYNLYTKLIEGFQQYYPASGKLVEPKVDLLCAARSVDGQWYRAKVLQCTETGAYVNFIDYGHSEEVAFDGLMILDEQFYLPYQLSVNVSLPVTLDGTIAEQIDILQSHLSNKELTGVFYNEEKRWVVELLYEGEKYSDKFRSLNSTRQQKTESNVVGCKYDVYVSHVDSPSQFWLQYVNEADDLAQKQKELQVQALTFPVVDGILEEGSLCVALYSIDTLWYRAQVLDADEDITTVRFIDYGNTDVIVNKSESIRQITDSWKEVKVYATKCRLDVIPIDSEDWNVAICEKFQNLVSSVESLQASIIADGASKRVDLFINEKSISETLVEDNQAIRVNTEEDLIDEIVDLELDPHSAFVSHINSPSEFWVQEEKSIGDLEVMSDRFIVADMFPKVDEVKENELCVAKYPEDEQWYRARVVSRTDQGVEVIYIDYGNSAVSTEIRAIPDDLANVQPLSRKCCLAMPDVITKWSDKACEEFAKLAADGATIFLLEVLKEDETSLVKLTLEGRNVADLLAEFCECYLPITEERLPPLGEENSPNANISHVTSPDEFWIQTESSGAELDAMLDRLADSSSFLPLDKIDVGTVCAAKFPKDEQWYRAKVLSHSELGTEVLYVDYGNTSLAAEVRMLPADIASLPPLSKRCALQKPATVLSWSTEACEAFEKLSEEGAATFEFEVLDSSDPVHVKLSINGKDVVDVLEPLCGSSSEASLKEAELEEVECHTDVKQTEIEDAKMEHAEGQDQKSVQGRSEENAEVLAESSNPEVAEIKADETTAEETLQTEPPKELTIDEIVQSMDRNEADDADKEQPMEAGPVERKSETETVEDNANVKAEGEVQERGQSEAQDLVGETESPVLSESSNAQQKEEENIDETRDTISLNTSGSGNLQEEATFNPPEHPEKEEDNNLIDSEAAGEVKIQEQDTEPNVSAEFSETGNTSQEDNPDAQSSESRQIDELVADCNSSNVSNEETILNVSSIPEESIADEEAESAGNSELQDDAKTSSKTETTDAQISKSDSVASNVSNEEAVLNDVLEQEKKSSSPNDTIVQEDVKEREEETRESISETEVLKTDAQLESSTDNSEGSSKATSEKAAVEESVSSNVSSEEAEAKENVSLNVSSEKAEAKKSVSLNVSSENAEVKESVSLNVSSKKAEAKESVSLNVSSEEAASNTKE